MRCCALPACSCATLDEFDVLFNQRELWNPDDRPAIWSDHVACFVILHRARLGLRACLENRRYQGEVR